MSRINGNKYGLTPRQERFVIEYCVDRNGQRAAIAAGYSKKIAGIMASKLLKKPAIIAAIARVNSKDNRRLVLTRERVLAELAKGLFRDVAGFETDGNNGFAVASLREVPPELRSIIDSFKVTQDLDEDGNPVRQRIEVKIIPKDRAQDMAMKHLGAYAAEKSESKVSLDWDALYGRSNIIDPVDDAVKRIEDNDSGSEPCER